uniref:Peptidase M16 N-terminal domain-containing protein n=1 Tax=Brassica campestris TaxID=3711 RepID=M4DVU9_BRACM
MVMGHRIFLVKPKDLIKEKESTGLLDSVKRFLHSAFCPSIDLHSMGFLYKLRFLRKRKYQEFEQNNWMDYPPDDYYEDLQDHYDDSDSDYYDAQLVQYDDEEDGNHDEDNDEENDAYIIRPDKSQKVYKSIVLRNGLTVLLISDSSAMSSTAAMTVRFGSINDPPDMMGIAHLIEHMLSRGSTENDFQSFVMMNGERVFAITDMEHSGFSFEIGTPNFQAGLKRFAKSFISPPMDVEDIKSEINTINQEWLGWKFRDEARLEQLFAHTTHVDHPFHRFTMGNKRSLSNHEPKSIRDAALELYVKHFVASCMKLVVIGADPVDKLERWVRKYFSELPRGQEINLAFPEYDTHRWKHSLWKHGVSYFLESLEGSQSMKISWILPPVSRTHVNKRPEMFILRLLCDESQGSLSSFFKSKLWITSLHVWSGHESKFSDVDSSSYCSTLAGQLFVISMDITDRGWEHKYDMVSYVYQYLNLLKSMDPPPSLPSLIEEFRSSMNMRFQCLDFDSNQLCDPSQFSLALAVNMLKFPVSHAISLDFGYDFGDFEDIKEMLRNFSTKNMRIDFLSKAFTEKGEREPFFSFTFKEENVPHSYLQRWEIPEETDPGLHLPFRNELMPTTSLLEVLEEEIVGSSFKSIADKCFYKENKGVLGKASLNIYLDPGQGVIPHMITRIYFEIIKVELSSLLFKAGEGYISTALSIGDDNTIVLELYGHPQRFKYLVASIWDKFKSFEPTPDCFQIITERMKRDFYVNSRDLIHHAHCLLSEAVFLVPFTMEDKYGVMKYITFDNLRRLLPAMRSEARVVAVFSGSVSKEDCKQITNLFQPFGV